MNRIYLGACVAFFTVTVIALLSNCKQTPQTTTQDQTAPTVQGHRIAYVNLDTLYEKYTWYKEKLASLSKDAETAQKSLIAKEDAFMRRVQEFQDRAQSGNVPPVELEKQQNKLSAEKEKLDMDRAKLQDELAAKGEKAQEQLLATVEDKLREIRTKIGYDYILGYQRGNPTILIANDQLDVTNQVIELLNAQEKK